MKKFLKEITPVALLTASLLAGQAKAAENETDLSPEEQFHSVGDFLENVVANGQIKRSFETIIRTSREKRRICAEDLNSEERPNFILDVTRQLYEDLRNVGIDSCTNGANLIMSNGVFENVRNFIDTPSSDRYSDVIQKFSENIILLNQKVERLQEIGNQLRGTSIDSSFNQELLQELFSIFDEHLEIMEEIHYLIWGEEN